VAGAPGLPPREDSIEPQEVPRPGCEHRALRIRVRSWLTVDERHSPCAWPVNGPRS
jgi:hypothetical protein